MVPERPNLDHIDPKIREYIEALETELAQFRRGKPKQDKATPKEPTGYTEPPTNFNIVTISQSGMIKCTPRHDYTRQHRSGMGVFDLELSDDDAPAFILNAHNEDYLLVLTDYARGYRLPLSKIPKSLVRSRGQKIRDLLNLPTGEIITAVVHGKEEGNLALVSQRGYVRLLRHNYVSLSTTSGKSLLDVGQFGPLAAASWTAAGDDIFIASRNGIGIRFQGKKVPTQGALGIRLQSDDEVVSVCGTYDDGSIFLLGSDGKGTVRQMEGFRANKAPGAGGKVAMKTNHLVGAIAVRETQDLFIISKLSKIIRFQIVEIPPKTGVVQGVHCISLRADEAVAVTTT